MLRVKTGCITCRIRRVKCDEAKPHCQRCESTGRKCDGYAKYQVSRKDLIAYTSHKVQRRKSSTPSSDTASSLVRRPSPIALRPSHDVFYDDIERMHFDFFRLKTAPSSNAFVSSRFWSHIVFQTSFDEPTIRHAALALSAWHRQYETHEQAALSFSLRQYEKALHHAHDLLKRADHDRSNVAAVLTALILFHSIQNCIGDYAAAEKSLVTTRALARDNPPKSHTDTINDLRFTLHRLEIHSSTFSDLSAPYRFDDAFELDGESTSWTFYTIETAFHVLLILLKDSFHISEIAYQEFILGEYVAITDEELHGRRRTLLSRLKQWGDGANALEERMTKSETMTMNMALMRVYHTIAMIVLCKDANQRESTWDLYIPQFAYILSTIESIIKAGFDDDRESHPVSADAPFSCELGIIVPLFLVAGRCRDPYIRRSAISLLAQSRRHEGRWDSLGAAAVCRTIVELEEEGAFAVTSCKDIPEHKRITSTLPRVYIAERKIDATFIVPGALTEAGQYRRQMIQF